MVLHPLRTKLDAFNNDIYFHVYSSTGLFSITFENHKTVPKLTLTWIIPNSNLQEGKANLQTQMEFSLPLGLCSPKCLNLLLCVLNLLRLCTPR